MQQPAKFLFTACLTTMAAAGPSITTAAEAEAPAQVLVQVDTPDQVMTAHWTRLPDAYVLRVVLDPRPTPARTEIAVPREIQQQRPVNPADALTPPAPNFTLPPPEGVTGINDLTRQDRASFFIGATIANLRGMDPSFGCRTLTLVDGRRLVNGQQPARPAPPNLQNQPYPPESRDSRVEVWLLKADGTLIPPATYSYSCRNVDVSYKFSLASTDQAVAAAIRIQDQYFIAKLQPPSTGK